MEELKEKLPALSIVSNKTHYIIPLSAISYLQGMNDGSYQIAVNANWTTQGVIFNDPSLTKDKIDKCFKLFDLRS